MFTSSLFLKPPIQTEFVVIIFDRPENRSYGRLLSEVFERKADYFILTTTSEKNYSFIASRIEKMQCKYCENYVFLWKLSHSHVFFVLLNLVKDQGPSSTIAFFRITSKILKVGTCNFTIIERNIKAIFRRYFSSLQFDPGYS